MDRLLRLDEVMNIVGLKTTAIYQAIRLKQFPSPVRIGLRAVAWRESHILNWIDTRPAASDSRQGIERS